MQGTNISHLWKKTSPNPIKGSLQMQGNKEDLVNERTQWFRRNLWAKEKCPLEGPKGAPLVGQPCSRGPAMPWGHLPACTNLTDPEKAAGCMSPYTLTCLYNRAAPGAKKEWDFPDMVLWGLHQKIARDSQRTGTHRISCVSTHDYKNPNGLNMSKPTLI